MSKSPRFYPSRPTTSVRLEIGQTRWTGNGMRHTVLGGTIYSWCGEGLMRVVAHLGHVDEVRGVDPHHLLAAEEYQAYAAEVAAHLSFRAAEDRRQADADDARAAALAAWTPEVGLLEFPDPPASVDFHYGPEGEQIKGRGSWNAVAE